MLFCWHSALKITYKSVHSPLFLTLYPPLAPQSNWTGCLDNNLLADSLCLQTITTAIQNFISDHAAVVTLLPLQWEALEAELHRVFIQHGARLKKELRMYPKSAG